MDTIPRMRSGDRLPALQPYDLAELPAEFSGGVVAVGNFDGLHRGHAALLDATRRTAADLGAPALVLTFEPHPRTLFRPETPVFRLTPRAAKARLLKALELDGIAVATFDRAFAAMAAEEFVERILVGRLKLKAAVVGFNFHFGRGRAGTPSTLAAAGQRLGFGVTVFDRISGEAGEPLSSSAIRESLAEGDVAGASRRLGYRWFVLGEVVAGDRRGRELGFPTANIRLGDDCRLRHGIYAVRLQRPGGAILDGVASYGRRPTFGGGPPILEVFLFDFSGDLYGEEDAVAFVDWIRPERAFSGAGELVAAMGRDSAEARAILAAAGPGTALDAALADNG
jgi:riboflavin kinase / FMN adenylyltransferase